MVLNYIGDVSSVRERQKEFISKVLEKRGYHDCDVVIELVGKAGENYIANVKRMVVTQNGETFKMIAKLAPENTMIREMANIVDLFRNEHVIYQEVFPKYRELQRRAGIPVEEWFRHAECYGSFLEAPNEVILLEDLKQSQFEILDRLMLMTNQCMKLVLKNFAVYHSLSYVLKNQEPEAYRVLKSKLMESYNVAPSQPQEIRKKICQQQEDSILLQLNVKYQGAVKGSFSNFTELLKEMKERETDSKYSVIQQGDGWMNNIMFVFEDDKPSQCVLIDYQMAKENNPIYDIMILIFNSTDTEQRIQHYTEYIDHYYYELEKSLRNYGLKASDVYPKDRLNSDMKRNAKIVMAVSFIITNLAVKDVEEVNKMLKSTETTTDNTEMALTAMMKQTTEAQVLFVQKMEGFAKSFIELGLM